MDSGPSCNDEILTISMKRQHFTMHLIGKPSKYKMLILVGWLLEPLSAPGFSTIESSGKTSGFEKKLGTPSMGQRSGSPATTIRFTAQKATSMQSNAAAGIDGFFPIQAWEIFAELANRWMH